VTKLKDGFTHKEWKSCCGKGCKKCDIAQAYIGRYGRSEGLDKLASDRDAVKKASKKGGKTRGGKKRKAKKIKA
jgi:hypothetical protein